MPDLHAPFPVSSDYRDDHARIRFSAPVGTDTVLALCDAIDTAIGYYQYELLVLEIESPGGEVSALRHYLTRLAAWRRTPGVTIRTRGLVHVASAAALMLSVGDVGERSAYSTTMLVYHQARILVGGSGGATSTWTRDHLRMHADQLEEVDDLMLATLIDRGLEASSRRTLAVPHALATPLGASGQLPPTRDALAACYQRLLALDVPITAAHAVSLGLIDEVVA